ncbi:MAG: GNAT family N-acetyltransferase [Rhodomicrobiaceae bacterium]
MAAKPTDANAASVAFRPARREDLDAVVRLLAADSLGQWRETLGDGSLPDAYVRVFNEIAADPRNTIIVGEAAGRIVACLQLTFIPGLTYAGGERAQIEGVRVDSAMRGAGVGKTLIAHVVELARRRGCVLVQLTTDKRRPDALAFYGSLGFAPSHEGMKLAL